MKNLLKKILTIVLIISGSMPVLFILVFHIQQQRIRHQVKEKMEEQLLQTVTVAAPDVVWIKYKKEIHLAGRMFDIKSIQLEDGHYTFTGLYDDEETTLKKNLAGAMNPENKKTSHRLIDFFQRLQVIVTDTEPENFFACIFKSKTRVYQIHISENPFKRIPTPPPQC